MSKFEDQIYKILVDGCRGQHLKVKREITFYDLKRKDRLRYDFGLYDDNDEIITIIETDGSQHYNFTSFFFKTEQEFSKLKEHDRIKNSYCLARNIPLYRIPYWELNNIKSIDDIIQDKFKVTSKWHNDKLRPPM